MKWDIVVSFDPSTLSANQRLHWGERRRRQLRVMDAAYVAWSMAGKPRAKESVAVSFTIRRSRTMDSDNALSGCKSAMDVLFKGRVTKDDSPKYVTIGTIKQIIGKQFKGHESVTFTVEEI